MADGSSNSHIGQLSIDASIDFSKVDIQKQLHEVLSNFKADVVSVEVELETSKLKAELADIMRQITGLKELLDKSVTQIGNDFDGGKFVEEYQKQIQAIAQTIKSISGQNPEIESMQISITALEKSLKSMGDKFQDALTKINSIPVQNSAIKQLGTDANATTEKLKELDERIESSKHKIQQLSNAKHRISDMNFEGQIPNDVFNKYITAIDKAKKELSTNTFTKALDNKHVNTKEFLNVYSTLNEIEKIKTAYKELDGIQILPSYEPLKYLDEVNIKFDKLINHYQKLQEQRELEKNELLGAPKDGSVSTESSKKKDNTLKTDRDLPISEETNNLEILQNKLLEVKQAIEAKTSAFHVEGETVDSVVTGEIEKLDSLQKKIAEITTALTGIGNHKPEEGAEATTSSSFFDIQELTKQLEKYRNQINETDAFKIKVLPEISLDEWISEISFQLQKLNSQKVKVDVGEAFASKVVSSGKSEERQLEAAIIKKAEAYQNLIDTELRTQQLQYKQIYNGGISAKETKELEKLTVARDKNIQLIKSSGSTIAEHVALENEWANKQREVTDSIFENAAALERQQKSADLTSKAIAGYKDMMSSEEKFQRLMGKRGGTDSEGGKDSNLTSSELTNLLSWEEKRLTAEKNILAAKQAGIDLSKQENAYEEKRAQVAEKVARVISATSDRSKNDAITKAYNQLIKSEKDFQAIELKRNGNDSNLSDSQLQGYIQLNRLRQESIGIINSVTNKTAEQTVMEEAYRREVESVTMTVARLSAAEDKRFKNKHGDYIFDSSSIQNAKAQITDYITSINAKLEGSVDWSKSVNGYVASLKQANGIVEKTEFHMQELEDGTYQVYKNTVKTGTATTWWGNVVSTIGGRMKALGAYLASFVSFYEVWGKFKQGVSVVKDLDTQLTEMRKVSEESIDSLKRYQRETFNVAKAVGSTASVIQSSTADYMRLGLGMKEAAEAAKATAILMNVSEFENINDATESLISMRQAYKELSDMEIIDKTNLAGNNFSISTSDLAQSLQQSAATLKVAGNDMNEAIALTVGANSILQDPLSAGKGVRTIALRLIGTDAAKKELEELGEDVSDFEVTTTSKMAGFIKDLTSVGGKEGFSILEDNGNYKSTYEILLGIAKVWKQIREEDQVTGRTRQEALLEKIAGKNRASVLGSVLDDAELLEDVYTQVQDASGSATEELNKYLESIDGHIQAFTNSWQQVWDKTLNSDIIKFFIDLGTGAGNTITKIGGLTPVVLSLGSALASLAKNVGRGKCYPSENADRYLFLIRRISLDIRLTYVS